MDNFPKIEKRCINVDQTGYGKIQDCPTLVKPFRNLDQYNVEKENVRCTIFILNAFPKRNSKYQSRGSVSALFTRGTYDQGMPPYGNSP